jgi:hypothetical protein
MDDECGAVGGMIGRGNRSTRRKPVPMPLCPPQIPQDATRARTQGAVGNRRLSARDTAWPVKLVTDRERRFVTKRLTGIAGTVRPQVDVARNSERHSLMSPRLLFPILCLERSLLILH